MLNNEGDNKDFTTYLSGNIRFLRKSRQWSQEELARHLDVKRSNIAAYESKNVEPRLSLLLKMAKLFNVDMAELIHTDISRAGAVKQPFKAPPTVASEDTLQVGEDISEEVLGEFVERSVSIRKMLEGFKVFYQFKRERQEMEGPGNGKPNIDIENFLNLIEHMLSLNEAVIEILDKTHREQKA